jgi:VWFA-related protein
MKIRSLIATLAFVPSLALSQDGVVSRDVRLADAGGRKLTINQIETSQFPKVSIFALVTENEQPVGGLSASDFKVREDEVPQEPIEVAAQVQPLSVIVTLDTSGSMNKAIGTAKAAAASFVDGLGSSDSVGVIGFSRAVSLLSPMSSTKAESKRAIEGLTARGDTALFDALYASLDATRGRPGRRAVVLLSDGVDDDGFGKVLSKKTSGDVLALAKELNVPVFTIGLGSEIDEKTLRNVANESGGAYFNAATAEDLSALYQKLGKQLSGQYHITYNSNLPGDGTVHTIQLLHNGLRGAKAYQSPSGIAAAPIIVTQPAVAQAQDSILEVVGGIDVKTAPLVPLNTHLKVKAPMNGDKPASTLYVAVDAASSTVITAGVLAPDRRIACMKVALYFPSLEEARWGSTCEQVQFLELVASINDTRRGKWVIGIENVGQPVDVKVVSRPFDDAASGKDAATADGTEALLVAYNTMHLGRMAKNDRFDRYSVDIPAAGTYQLRVRPSSQGSVSAEVFNDEGVRLRWGSSSNQGAGFTLDFEVKNPGRIEVKLEGGKQGSSELEAYNFIIGQALAAPPQPAMEYGESSKLIK